MALRIACDVDGTVADMDSALQCEAERLFGPNICLHGTGGMVVAMARAHAASARQPMPSGESRATGKRPLTRAEIRRLWAHVRRLENFWMGLKEIEAGGVARLGALASEYGWQVIFLTQRPATEGFTAQVQTQRWLEAHGFDRPSVFVMDGSRGSVAAALKLDVVIDDREENARDVAASSKARPLLVWRAPRQALSPASADAVIHVVGSFGEAVDCLDQMTRNAGAPRRLIDRLRAAIGI